MLLKRVSILGSSAILLFHVSGCSSQGPGDAARAGNSGEQTERVGSTAAGSKTDPPGPLDVAKIDLWKNVLTKPPTYVGTPVLNAQGEVTRQDYTVTVRTAVAQMLPPDLPTTKVLAYAGMAAREGKEPVEYEGSPGATFEMTRGIPARVKWINQIKERHVLDVDPGPHAPPQALTDVPYVTHLHGLEVAPKSDGSPNAWFTSTGRAGENFALTGDVYDYPNSQPATTLWYHDHTFGMTRLNVYAGLAGMYVIRDPRDAIENPQRGVSALPKGAYEMPLVIQDRSFNDDGSLAYTSLGSTNVVNGKVWPQMEVERTRYRFRILNGANSRYYNLSRSDGGAITLIGSDGGYLPKASDVTSLPLAPGERADVLIDFSSTQDEFVTLTNDADIYDPMDLMREVVRFKVPSAPSTLPKPVALPDVLNTLPELTSESTRTVTLHMADDGSSVLNGQPWHGEDSEKPRVGTTEDWDIVNLSGMSHPIHLHLVQFRVVWRETFDETGYVKRWSELNGSALPLHTPTVPLAADEFLSGARQELRAAESGWKDTVDVPAGTVTRIRVRWAPQEATSVTPGTNPFDFNATASPGYVWHCHILEHEDNDMMRPLKLVD